MNWSSGWFSVLTAGRLEDWSYNLVEYRSRWGVDCRRRVLGWDLYSSSCASRRQSTELCANQRSPRKVEHDWHWALIALSWSLTFLSASVLPGDEGFASTTSAVSLLSSRHQSAYWPLRILPSSIVRAIRRRDSGLTPWKLLFPSHQHAGVMLRYAKPSSPYLHRVHLWVRLEEMGGWWGRLLVGNNWASLLSL